MSIEEKAEKLCSGFSLLDEEEQGYIWGILEALLFAKLKTDAEMDKENGFINTR